MVYLVQGREWLSCRVLKYSPIQIQYARFGFPATFLNSVVIYSSAIVMPMLFGNWEAGLFALAYRVGYFPASLMSQSLGAVFRRDLIDFYESLQNGGDPRNPTRAFLLPLSLISAGLVAACYAGLSPIVHLKMGDQWEGSLSTYLLLLPYFILMSIYGSMAAGIHRIQPSKDRAHHPVLQRGRQLCDIRARGAGAHPILVRHAAP